MEEVTLEKLAKDVGTTVDRLIQQFAEAGIKKTPDDGVTEDEKQKLLAHLNKQHGGGERVAFVCLVPRLLVSMHALWSSSAAGEHLIGGHRVRDGSGAVSRTDELMLAASRLRGPMDAGLHRYWCEAKDQHDYDKLWWSDRQRELERSYPRTLNADHQPNSRFGCSNTHDVLGKDVITFLDHIHGPHPHSHNSPDDMRMTTADPVDETSEFRARLAEAVEREDYETAARLRDQINRIMCGATGHAPASRSETN